MARCWVASSEVKRTYKRETERTEGFLLRVGEGSSGLGERACSSPLSCTRFKITIAPQVARHYRPRKIDPVDIWRGRLSICTVHY